EPDQLKYYRLISKTDDRSKERWQKCFSWYPGRQNIEFNRVAQIYCDSRHTYGDEAFMKYAQQKRLNNKHTITISHQNSFDVEQKELSEQSSHSNNNAKVPPTTNGEYGRLKPTRMHYC
ncbi:hypothetical protein KR044_007552, partial [Drosophila immigrans]